MEAYFYGCSISTHIIFLLDAPSSKNRRNQRHMQWCIAHPVVFWHILGSYNGHLLRCNEWSTNLASKQAAGLFRDALPLEKTDLKNCLWPCVFLWFVSDGLPFISQSNMGRPGSAWFSATVPKLAERHQDFARGHGPGPTLSKLAMSVWFGG